MNCSYIQKIIFMSISIVAMLILYLKSFILYYFILYHGESTFRKNP